MVTSPRQQLLHRCHNILTASTASWLHQHDNSYCSHTTFSLSHRHTTTTPNHTQQYICDIATQSNHYISCPSIITHVFFFTCTRTHICLRHCMCLVTVLPEYTSTHANRFSLSSVQKQQHLFYEESVDNDVNTMIYGPVPNDSNMSPIRQTDVGMRT